MMRFKKFGAILTLTVYNTNSSTVTTHESARYILYGPEPHTVTNSGLAD